MIALFRSSMAHGSSSCNMQNEYRVVTHAAERGDIAIFSGGVLHFVNQRIVTC